ncbi:MAG TPA: MFS transporter [Gemmatimonadaceae bacterium]|nr:MFS transporter [Gemmatimonadaceae bacterium]
MTLPRPAKRTEHAAAPQRRARIAASAFFSLLGVSVSTWSALVPATKSRLALSDAGLGAVLLAFGAGTIASTLVAGWLVGRHGSRRVLVLSSALLSLCLPLLALAPSVVTLASLLFAFGACVGLAGVAANAHAITLQTRVGRPLMSSLHAMFSVGGLAGASACSLLMRAGLSGAASALLVMIALLALVFTQRTRLVADLAAVRSADDGASGQRSRIPPLAILVVGAMTFALYLSEGAVLDWGAVFLHEARGYDVATAALGYAAFSIMMAIGRAFGDRVVARVGTVTVVRAGALLAAGGFLTMVLAPAPSLGLVGCALIGLGASNVVPTLISASARVSSLPTGAAVSTVVAMGTTGLIAGPALIGFLAQQTSLGAALSGLAVLLLGVGAAAGMVRTRRTAA